MRPQKQRSYNEIVPQEVWNDKYPFILRGPKAKERAKFCSPSPEIVRSSYERNIPEWDQNNRYTNKQLINQNCSPSPLAELYILTNCQIFQLYLLS